jgi:hypothetical protein
MRTAKNGVASTRTPKLALAFILSLLISAFGATSAAAKDAAPKGALDEAQVLALQKKFQKASVDANMPALSAILTDNATLIHGNGLVQTKAEYINSITTGKMKFTAYDLKDSKVIFFKDGAIVVGLADIGLAPPHGADGASPRLLHMRISGVWLRKLDGWQLILSQDTPLAGSSPSSPSSH